MKTLWLALMFLVCATPAWATTRYVAPAASGGDNANTCATSANIATPKLTFLSAIACMAAGDTLFARAGTYTEIQPVFISGKNGSQSLPYTISGYQSEVVTLAPVSATSTGRGLVVSTSSYIVITKLIFDGISASTDAAENKIEFSHHVTITNNEIKRWKSSGIYLTSADNITITGNSFHDMTDTCAVAHRPYGLYYSSGSNATIEKNDFYNNGGGGMQIYPGPLANIIITRNLVHANNVCPSSSVGGILVGTNASSTFTGGQIINNVIYGNTSSDGTAIASGITLNFGSNGTKVLNNTIYNNDGWGIRFINGSQIPSNNVLANNILLANSAGTISSGGTSTTTQNNKTTGTITDCTVSTSDFTQKSGSSCINAGMAQAGFLYNASAPDQGAFEAIAHSTCVVDNGEATTLKITFSNDVAPPLLPATGMTGFTARKATANDVVTATTRTGDNQVFLTLTTAIANGDAVDYSYAPGNVTDSMLIGNTTKQPMLTITQQTCTNNVGAAATQTFTQAAFEFHGLRGTEAAPVGTPYATAPENTNILVHAGGAVRLRIAVTCTVADCQPTGFFPRYSKNGGAYTLVVPDTFGADGIAFLGTGPDPDIPANGTTTTDQLSTSGTFVAGALVRTSNAIPTVDIAQNGKTELEYIFTFGPTAAADATFDIRLYKQDGTPLDTYTVTPRITIFPCGMFVGF